MWGAVLLCVASTGETTSVILFCDCSYYLLVVKACWALSLANWFFMSWNVCLEWVQVVLNGRNCEHLFLLCTNNTHWGLKSYVFNEPVVVYVAWLTTLGPPVFLMASVYMTTHIVVPSICLLIINLQMRMYVHSKGGEECAGQLLRILF